MDRTIAIGDIHGGLKALVQVLKRIDVLPSDTFIFLGDYVDGWSDSAKTVSYLIEFAKKNNCVFIRGNHDALTEKWLKEGDINQQWLQHGGKSTIYSYKDFSSEEIAAHLEFYSGLHNYYIDSTNNLFVHAGFTNSKGPDEEPDPVTLFWDRTFWEMVMALDENLDETSKMYPEHLRLFKEIYIGHTPVTRMGKEKPVNIANVWNVDTGAAFKGKISAIEITTKQIWQSDLVYELYPNEDGRN